MSARVCLNMAIAWSLLVLPVAAQVRRSDAHDPPGGATSQTMGFAAEGSPGFGSGESISNLPRSVSQVGDVPRTTRGAGTARPAPGDVRDGEAPMPLPPRSERQRRQAKSSPGSSSGRALLTVLSSLAIVLAVFFVFVWVTRSAAPKGMAPLSKEVVESLGRAPLLGRQQMQLIRVGNKLILLSVTNTGADTLTEITDPEEVDRLSALCRQSQSGSISDSFRQVLAQASSEPGTATRSQRRPIGRPGSMEPHRA